MVLINGFSANYYAFFAAAFTLLDAHTIFVLRDEVFGLLFHL